MTPAQLSQATGARLDRATEWLPYLSLAMRAYSINTPARQAAFLAQIGHESGSLKYSVEIWGPTSAQTRYEGRKDLGNTVEGDGFKYRGRGLIQTTGRSNYQTASNALGVDFVNNPELLERPEFASKSAAMYWATHGLNELADSGDFEKITRRINGGLNGFDDRKKRWESAKIALAGIVESEPLPTPVTPSFGTFLLGLLKMFSRKK